MPVLETFDRYRVTTYPADTLSLLLICTPADPFGLDHDCLNPAGHDFTSACGEVVCPHCGKVAWS